MSLDQRDLERLLSGGEVPEPPPELLPRLLEEIPAQLELPGASRWHRRPSLWRLVAAVSLVLGGGWLTVRLREVPLAPTSSEPSIARSPGERMVARRTDPVSGETGDSMDAEQSREELARKVLPKRRAEQGRRTEASSPAPAGEAEEPSGAGDLAPSPPAPAAGSARAAVEAQAKTEEVEGWPTAARRSPPSRAEADLPAPEDRQRELEASAADERRQEGRSPTVSRPLGAAIDQPPLDTVMEEIVVTTDQLLVAKTSASSSATSGDRSTAGADRATRRHDVLPFVDTETATLARFGLRHRDDSVWRLEEALEAGKLPHPDEIRLEELVAGLGEHGSTPPAEGDDFRLTVEGAPSPWQSDRRFQVLRFSLRARERSTEEQNQPGAPWAIAEDATVSVRFDPRVVARWRLLGHESPPGARWPPAGRALGAEIDPGFGMTVVFEVQLRVDAPRGGAVGTLTLHYRRASSAEPAETGQVLWESDLTMTMVEGSRELQLVAMIAELAERLRESPYVSRGDWPALQDRAAELSRRFPGDAAVSRLARLVRRATEVAAAAGGSR